MRRLASSAAVLAVAAAALVGTAGPSSAVTEHCPDGPGKVELNYETTTVNLPAGSTVCYKAGTKVDTVTVGSDGVLTSTITNRNGVVQGISYYIVTHYCPPTYS